PDGAESSKTFFDDDAALAALGELVAEKQSEGWVEIVPVAPPAARKPPKRKPRATTQEGAKEQILDQLRPGISAASADLLCALVSHAEILLDGDDATWRCVSPPPWVAGEAPGEEIDLHLEIDRDPAREIPANAPPSLARFLEVCAGMVCGEAGDTG